MHALYRNHMGNDLEVVNDARVSFGTKSKALEWKTIDTIHREDDDVAKTFQRPVLNQKDQGLIRFLARGCTSQDWKSLITEFEDELDREDIEALIKHVRKIPTHWTPFGHQQIKLVMKAPIPIRTQCYKSKIGMVENEESRRYIDSTPELFTPWFRLRPDGSIKQGSGAEHPNTPKWRTLYKQQCYQGIRLYEEMIEDLVCPEQARFVLPQGCHVNWVWTGSLYAYAEFYNKRSDRAHAQQEIADLCEPIDRIMSQLFPYSWDALTR